MGILRRYLRAFFVLIRVLGCFPPVWLRGDSAIKYYLAAAGITSAAAVMTMYAKKELISEKLSNPWIPYAGKIKYEHKLTWNGMSEYNSVPNFETVLRKADLAGTSCEQCLKRYGYTVEPEDSFGAKVKYMTNVLAGPVYSALLQQRSGDSEFRKQAKVRGLSYPPFMAIDLVVGDYEIPSSYAILSSDNPSTLQIGVGSKTIPGVPLPTSALHGVVASTITQALGYWKYMATFTSLRALREQYRTLIPLYNKIHYLSIGLSTLGVMRGYYNTRQGAFVLGTAAFIKALSNIRKFRDVYEVTSTTGVQHNQALIERVYMSDNPLWCLDSRYYMHSLHSIVEMLGYLSFYEMIQYNKSAHSAYKLPISEQQPDFQSRCKGVVKNWCSTIDWESCTPNELIFARVSAKQDLMRNICELTRTVKANHPDRAEACDELESMIERTIAEAIEKNSKAQRVIS